MIFCFPYGARLDTPRPHFFSWFPGLGPGVRRFYGRVPRSHHRVIHVDRRPKRSGTISDNVRVSEVVVSREKRRHRRLLRTLSTPPARRLTTGGPGGTPARGPREGIGVCPPALP